MIGLLIRNSVDQGLSWESECLSIGQEIPLLYEPRNFIAVLTTALNTRSWLKGLKLTSKHPVS
jgi:hypothetical protein